MPEKRIKISLPEDKQIHIDRDIKRFLPSAGEAELKVLLYSLCEREFSLSEAAEFLQLDKSDIESAVGFWRGAQLLGTADEDKSRQSVKTGLYQSYDSQLLSEQLDGNKDFKALCDYMEKKLEKLLNKNDINMIFYLYDFVGLSAEYIMALTEYCIQKGKHSMQYIMKTALGKADEGIDTYEKLEEWLKLKRTSDDKKRRFASACGWGNREPSANEKKYLEYWFDENQASYELVHLAYEKTVDSIGVVKLPYMSKILESWFEKGYKTPEDVKNDRKEDRQQSGSAESYDVDEFFAAAVEKGMRRNAR